MRGMAAYYRQELEALDAAGELRHEENGVRVHAKPTFTRGRDYVHLRMWAGKRAEADYNYLVEPDKVEELIAKKVEAEGRRAALKKEQRAEAKAKAAEMAAKLTPGTLLHGSWGYNQTNCELYQIVSRPSARKAVIRQIAGEQVESEGYSPMACMLSPVKDKFVGPEVTVSINAYGCRLHDHCNLSPTSEDSQHYSSWYA